MKKGSVAESDCDPPKSQSMEPNNGDESPIIGGDRKRRCVEIIAYEAELQDSGVREPQPVSAFKPKCLNFDDV